MALHFHTHPFLIGPLAVLALVGAGGASLMAAPLVPTGRPSSLIAPLGNSALSSLPRTYRLGPGDRLKIEFLDVPEFSGEQTVLTDGTITLPRTGALPVEGLSVEQLQQLLAQRFSAYLLRPVVAVGITQVRPIRITLVGEVQRPGVYSLSLTEASKTGATEGSTISGFPTLTTAIQKAGGISQQADLTNVVLRRSNGGQQASQALNLWALIRNGDTQQNPYLLDGDVIEVNRVRQLNPKDVVEAAQANLSPEFITVYVGGEVASPGKVQIKANSTINQAILAAGGLNQRADVRTAELIRLERDGSAMRRSIALNYGQGVDLAENPPLRNDDAVVVYASTFTQVTDGLTRVLAPITGATAILNIFGLRF